MHSQRAMRLFCHFASVLVVVVTVSGCAAGRLYERGKKLEDSRNYYGASLEYLAALDKDPGHADAKQHLKAVAERGYTQKLRQAEHFVDAKETKLALKSYQELKHLLDRLAARDAKSFETVDVGERIVAAENAHAEQFYAAADAAFAARRWDEAIKGYQEALKVVKQYKDAVQKIASTHYAWAEELLGARQYRKAMAEFGAANKAVGAPFRDADARVADIALAYARHFTAADHCRQAAKDLGNAKSLSSDPRLDQALAAAETCATVTLAIPRVENATRRPVGDTAVEDVLTDAVEQKVRKRGSRFLQLLDRSVTEQVARERTNATPEELARSGQLRAARYLAVAKLTTVSVDSPAVKATKATGTTPESYVCGREKDGRETTCMHDVPITYLRHDGSARVRLAGTLKIVDVRRGNTIATVPLDAVAEDSVAYGDTYRYADSGQPFDTARFPIQTLFNEARQLAEARNTLKGESELAAEVVERLSDTIAGAVLQTVDSDKAPPDPPVLDLGRT